MGFDNIIDKFINREKAAQATIKDPREIFNSILRQTSGSAFTRDLKYDIFYSIIAFYGVVEGVGTSTLVANTALAIAQMGLTVCVIDTSVIAPVQDVLLKTAEAVNNEHDGQEHLDWYDMPYTRKSVLHVSKINKNVSVLSFKGKKHGFVDILSTNDSETLVDIAFTELHNKFDIVLIDCCHELTAVNTACLQQAQQVIQVWNDSPTVLASLENFITQSIVVSCPLDKMRNVVYSRIVKDAIGSLDGLIEQYRLRHIATSYTSEELSMLIVTGKTLWQCESLDPMVVEYTNCIIDIACHILNIRDDSNDPKGTITSNDIMEGKVDGTLHKDLSDFNDRFQKEHPELVVQKHETVEEYGTDNFGVVLDDGEDIEVPKDVEMSESVSASGDSDYSATLEEDEPEVEQNEGKKRGLFGKRRR